jgi:CD109 antigen
MSSLLLQFVHVGITLSGQGLTSFYSSSIKIKFHDSTPETFKPGLTFVAWILVTTQDNKPVDGITVSVTPWPIFGSMSSVDIKVTAGLAKFTYDVHSSTTSLTIEATCQDSQTGTSVSAQQYLTMSQSPSRSFIQLTTTTSSAKIGMPLEYQVESTFPFSDLYYQVLGRGNVVMEGTKNLSIPSANTNLAIDVTHEMAPSAQILVYVIRNDGEVVVDSLTVSVVSAFKNEVNITFASLEKKPGDNVTVSITATPDSYVGVAAVDYSVALLADNNDITQSEVVDELQSYDTSKRPWNDDLGWEVNRKKRTVIYPWSPGGYDAYSIFDNAGILVMTDATIYRDKTRDYNYHRTIPACADCIAYFDGDREQASVLNAGIESKQPPQKGDLLEPQQVRTFFPETWLWANSITNANGLAEITSKVPDTITTWVASAFAFSNITGLGVPVDSAELKVFQPFFISLTLPYSVIRGEQLGLKVTVFNYLEENLENVSVELEENEDLIPVTYDVMTNEVNSISPAESLALSKSISISAKNGATVVFAVTPKRVGTIAIKVKAQSSNYRAADAVERSLLVVPEGRPVDYTHNVFIQLDQSDDALQQSLSLALPSDVVPNSARAMISVTGDLLGPTLNNLEQLVRMPYGCGEQNAASTAPNIFARQYLESTQQLTIKLKEKTNKYMITGYQRELNYRHNDGSYSAWGGSDDSGSLWLTAFVMKLYALASYYVTIDSRQVELSTSWIAQQQSKTTGVFTSVGRLVDTYISGGLEGDTARTAFVLIALIEARNAPSVAVSSDVSNAITKAQSYLEGKLASTTDSYAICIVAYALTLSGSAKSSEAIAKLNSIAVKDGGSTHWTNADGQSKQSNTDDFLYYPYHAPSADIEMTGYALLAITATGNVANGLPVAKWLSQQRNSLGGWSSTQDTCVALEALATYAAAVHGEAGSLDIELTSAIDEQFIHILSVDSENALVLQQAEVPVGGNLDMVVNGTGTVLLQATVSYNVPMHQQSEPAYQLVVDVTEKNGGNNIIVTLCSTYMKNSDSGMVVVSSTLPSGFGVDDDAMQTYLNSQEDVERYDVSGNQVDLYLNQLVYKSRKCVQVTASRQYDVGAVQPVPAVVYSYYEPDLERESVLYAPSSMVGVTVCELCLCDEYCAGCDGYKKTIDCSVFGQSSSAMAISSCHIFMYILVVFITTLIALLK